MITQNLAKIQIPRHLHPLSDSVAGRGEEGAMPEMGIVTKHQIGPFDL